MMVIFDAKLNFISIHFPTFFPKINTKLDITPDNLNDLRKKIE